MSDEKPLLLCLLPLTKTWGNIQQMQKRGQLANGLPLHVVLFDSVQEGQPTEQDAFHAGAVAKRCFQNSWNANVPVDFCLYERTRPYMTVEDAEGQISLDPHWAAYIDEKLKTIATEQVAERMPKVLVDDARGYAEVKPVLRASCRLRFGGRVHFLPAPDRPISDEEISTILIPPDESLETRYTIRRLIHQGAFDLAATLALPPNTGDKYVAEPWRQWLRTLAKVLGGDWSDFEQWNNAETQSSRILAFLRRLDKSITSPRSQSEGRIHREGSLIVSFRVESALRREDWTWAIRETLTLGDALRIDLFNRHFSRKGEVMCSDDLQRHVDPNRVQSFVLHFLEKNYPQFDPRQNSLRKRKGKKPVYWLLNTVWDDLDELLPDHERIALQKLRSANRNNRKFQYRHSS